MAKFLQVGDNVMIRTVVYHYIGQVEAIIGDQILLRDACWVAEGERMERMLREGVVREAEPFPNGCVIAKATICDYCPWDHELITTSDEEREKQS